MTKNLLNWRLGARMPYKINFTNKPWESIEVDTENEFKFVIEIFEELNHLPDKIFDSMSNHKSKGFYRKNLGQQQGLLVRLKRIKTIPQICSICGHKLSKGDIYGQSTTYNQFKFCPNCIDWDSGFSFIP